MTHLKKKYIRFPSARQTTGALVEWLKEETQKQKVVSSNPGTGYWMDIFTLFCYKIC